MAATRSYPAGVPCWIDTDQPDPDAARRFYGKLFDWTFEALGGGDDGPHLAFLNRQPVAAISPAGAAPGPVAWNTSIAVDDADATAQAVSEEGGEVELAPGDVGSAGRLAICTDPQGARFRVWQARDHSGAQAVNLPGSWNFSDPHTPDPDAALRFYGKVFGWEAKAIDAGAGEWATLVRVPGYGEHLRETVDPDIYERQQGAPEGFADGIAFLAGLEPEHDQPHWHVTFTVIDRAETAKTAQRLGGEILSERDTSYNRSAHIVDPQGAEFTISQFLGL